MTTILVTYCSAFRIFILSVAHIKILLVLILRIGPCHILNFFICTLTCPLIEFTLPQNGPLNIKSLLWGRINNSSFILLLCPKTSGSSQNCKATLKLFHVLYWVSMLSCLWHWMLDGGDVDDFIISLCWFELFIQFDLILLFKKFLVFYLLSDLVLNVI